MANRAGGFFVRLVVVLLWEVSVALAGLFAIPFVVIGMLCAVAKLGFVTGFDDKLGPLSWIDRKATEISKWEKQAKT